MLKATGTEAEVAEKAMLLYDTSAIKQVEQQEEASNIISKQQALQNNMQ